MKVLTAFLLSLVAASAAADNDRGFYLGVGAGLVQFHDGSNFAQDDSDLDFRVLEVLGGYKYNSALGLDLRVGTSRTERATSGVAPAISEWEFSIDRYESIYYRPELANEQAKLYALIGYSQLERSRATANESEETDKDSGSSYGLGIGFVVNTNGNINFEYRRLIDKRDHEINIKTISFDYRF